MSTSSPTGGLKIKLDHFLHKHYNMYLVLVALELLGKANRLKLSPKTSLKTFYFLDNIKISYMPTFNMAFRAGSHMLSNACTKSCKQLVIVAENSSISPLKLTFSRNGLLGNI